MTAQARGWGPPPAARNRVDGSAKAELSGATFPGGVHVDVVELVETLLWATEKRGYVCVVGWCWGHAARRIRGSSRWSNHAWAIAVDINAPRNPMTSTLVTDMPAWMPRMWEACNFRWGGRYKTRPDAMHYEYMGRPADVPADLARARGFLREGGGQTTTQEGEVLLKEGSKGVYVEYVQQWLRRYFRTSRIAVDRNFGPKTRDWLAEFQSQRGLLGEGGATPGVCDQVTFDVLGLWAHYRAVPHQAA